MQQNFPAAQISRTEKNDEEKYYISWLKNTEMRLMAESQERKKYHGKLNGLSSFIYSSKKIKQGVLAQSITNAGLSD